MRFLDKKKNEFLQNYTTRLLFAAYLVADVQARYGWSADEFNEQVLKCLRGEAKEKKI